MKNNLQTPRGYFDQVCYINGQLIVNGWMLLPDNQLDSISVQIDGKRVCEAAIVDRDDLANAFPFIRHAKHSGFSVSLHGQFGSQNRLIGICLIGTARRRQVAKMETWYSPKVSIPPPPAILMKRELNNDSISYFEASCFKSYRELWELICKYRNPKSIRTMLDWGCGCGRLIYMFLSLSGISGIHGCDIDPEAIDWCKQKFITARFAVNPPFPPTQYPDSYFDLVIGNSVFTHLTKDIQLIWLEEMKRIISPGGLFLASVHGEFATYFGFPGPDDKNILGKEGIYDHVRDPDLDGIAPEGYYRGTFQSQEYTRKTFGRHFGILEYVERGYLNFQDFVVMEKNNTRLTSLSDK